MHNVDVKVTVDVRVDPVGVALLLASFSLAFFFIRRSKDDTKHLAG